MNNVTSNSAVEISLVAALVVAYAGGIIYLFTRTVNGRRRRWAPLDFVWVPMGAVTVALIAVLWWKSR